VHHFYLQDTTIWIVPLQRTSSPLWKSFISLRDRLLDVCGGQQAAISMMQSWVTITTPFSTNAYEFLRIKGTPVSCVSMVWESWCLPRHSFILWLALLDGWEQEIYCILLILMLIMSSIRIMRRAIVTFSLPAVGRPSYGWKLNPGLGFAEVWAPSTVLFGASILRAKSLLLEWKRSPSALLSIWYGKKGI